MADINEVIVTGRKYRRLYSRDDDGTQTWQTLSFWKMAEDVHFDDGTTAQDRMDALEDITY